MDVTATTPSARETSNRLEILKFARFMCGVAAAGLECARDRATSPWLGGIEMPPKFARTGDAAAFAS
jgi:hypothetical protein